MKFIIYFTIFALVEFYNSVEATKDKKEIQIDNRLICMKGKKNAKLNEIEYVGTVRTSIDLMTFFKQFKPAHVIPKENKKNNWVSPKFIIGTLSAIARRECKQFDKKKKLAKDEVYGIIFPNGKQFFSLFHDNDFKWNGAGSQLKWNWQALSNYEDVV